MSILYHTVLCLSIARLRQSLKQLTKTKKPHGEAGLLREALRYRLRGFALLVDFDEAGPERILFFFREFDATHWTGFVIHEHVELRFEAEDGPSESGNLLCNQQSCMSTQHFQFRVIARNHFYIAEAEVILRWADRVNHAEYTKVNVLRLHSIFSSRVERLIYYINMGKCQFLY